MDIEQAIDIIYTGLVCVDSVPVKLASYRILDLEMLVEFEDIGIELQEKALELFSK